MAVTVKGLDAEIKWVYHRAARLHRWALHDDGKTVTVTATVEEPDAMRLSQRPLTFVVTRPTGSWKWPVETLQIVDQTVTVTLGPQE